MSMSLTRAKAVAANPSSCTIEELDEALSTIVDSDRLSEQQVTNLQNKIEPELRSRLREGHGITPLETLDLTDELDMGIAAMDRDGIQSVGKRVREIVAYGKKHPVLTPATAFICLEAIAPSERPPYPADDDDVTAYTEMEEYNSRQYYLAQTLQETCAAGLEARRVASDAEAFRLPAELQLKTMGAYATYVMTALWLQASTEEWGMPTSWTDGVVDNDGWIAVHNAGKEENTNWQGEDVDYFRIDETGLTIKSPEF